MSVKRKIFITANCQAKIIAQALERFCYKDQISYYEIKSLDYYSDISAQLSVADVWVTSLMEKSQREFSTILENRKTQIINIPTIYFNAFHPDLVGMSSKEGVPARNIGRSTFHSRLVFYGKLRGLSELSIARLFNREVFDALGYTSIWSIAKSKLEESFNKSSIDFAQFFLPSQKMGIFMNTPSQPRAAALVQLAKIIAQQLQVNPASLSDPIEFYVKDFLARGNVWPLYPEIGDVLGIKGGYCWRINDAIIPSLPEYIARSYRVYENFDIASWQFSHLGFDKIDQVLRNLSPNIIS